MQWTNFRKYIKCDISYFDFFGRYNTAPPPINTAIQALETREQSTKHVKMWITCCPAVCTMHPMRGNRAGNKNGTLRASRGRPHRH